MNWPYTLSLSEVARGKGRVRLEPDAASRQAIAKELGLESLGALSAELSYRPWMDGAEITARFEAKVSQVCGVSLDVFEQVLVGDLEFRVVPQGSPNAPAEITSTEVEFDSETPDPPDVLQESAIDLSRYVVEHLALAIDPFPRKPGVVFDYEPEVREESPFAVLKRLTDKEA